MKFTRKIKPPFDRTKWHVWFAWHPIVIVEGEDKHFVWLERVERELEYDWIDIKYNYRYIQK